jgi:hypothetical protein
VHIYVVGWAGKNDDYSKGVIIGVKGSLGKGKKGKRVFVWEDMSSAGKKRCESPKSRMEMFRRKT